MECNYAHTLNDLKFRSKCKNRREHCPDGGRCLRLHFAESRESYVKAVQGIQVEDWMHSHENHKPQKSSSSSIPPILPSSINAKEFVPTIVDIVEKKESNESSNGSSNESSNGSSNEENELEEYDEQDREVQQVYQQEHEDFPSYFHQTPNPFAQTPVHFSAPHTPVQMFAQPAGAWFNFTPYTQPYVQPYAPPQNMLSSPSTSSVASNFSLGSTSVLGLDELYAERDRQRQELVALMNRMAVVSKQINKMEHERAMRDKEFVEGNAQKVLDFMQEHRAMFVNIYGSEKADEMMKQAMQKTSA